MEILVNFNLGHDGSWDGVEECMKDILLAIDSSYTSKLKVLEGALEKILNCSEWPPKEAEDVINWMTDTATQALARVRGNV